MSQLALTEDELAMLRFTCDLFFVEESPLFFLEAEKRAPYNYEAAYNQLKSKDVVDPSTFQVTDAALNRIAPVTECDARVIHSHLTKMSKDATDYYLLDEIIVKYKDQQTNHLMGADMDIEQFIQFLGRRLTPRSSGGDLLLVDLSPIEVVALATLLNPLRDNPDASVEQNIHKLPPLTQDNPSLLPTSGPKNTLNALGVRTLPRQKPSQKIEDSQTNKKSWKKVFESLLAKSVLKRWNNEIKVSLAFKEFFFSLDNNEYHSFVRYDFGDDEWFIRESTLIPANGSLYWIGMDKKGLVTIKELDGAHLKKTLLETVGPLNKN